MLSAFGSAVSRSHPRESSRCWARQKRRLTSRRRKSEMKAFQYVTATSPASARELAGSDGRFLAGGMDLLSEMKEYIAQPKTVVNIKSLPGLNKIESSPTTWSIG